MITLVLIGFSIEIRVESRNIIYTGHEFNVLVALMCSSLNCSFSEVTHFRSIKPTFPFLLVPDHFTHNSLVTSFFLLACQMRKLMHLMQP